MPEQSLERQPRLPGRTWMRWLLPLLVILLGVGVAMLLMKTAPSAKRAPAAKQARLVETLVVNRAPVALQVEAMGTVIPARVVTLQPQVSGEVLTINENLLPGGLLNKGEELLRIDDQDYQLAVQQRESELIQAQSNLQIEQGQQLIARQELKLLGDEVDTEELDLLLRKPQLQSSKANITLAEAALARARLDLQRTRIRAPFAALVQSRDIDPGSRVNSNTHLATLIGSDRFWVELAVPVDELKWIQIPRNEKEEGSEVHIYDEAAWGQGVYRNGRVIRLAGELDSAGRMAKLLVEIEDPLAQQPGNADQPPLLINSYVRATIQGRIIPAAVSLPRELLRDNDRVWLMDDDERLEIRAVQVAFRGPERVVITDGLAAGERVVATNLAAPVHGMALRLVDSEEELAVPQTAVEAPPVEAQNE